MKSPDAKPSAALPALIAGLGVFVFLAWLAAVPQPYEQDEIAKAAKMISMADTGRILAPEAGLYYYRDEVFGLYYMAGAALHAVLRQNIFLELNLVSAVAGGLFCGLTAFFLRRNFAIPVWLTALMAITTPAFNHVFSFGNETAPALAAFALALVLVDRPSIWRNLVAGIIFGLSLHFRPDAALLGPFLFAWTVFCAEGGTFKARLISGICLGATTVITGLLFWAAFVKRMPVDVAFDMKFNPQFFAALLLYSFAPVLLPAAAMGAWQMLRHRLKPALVFLLMLLPLLYYAKMLSSPKYVAFLVLPLWLLAGVGLMRPGRWLRAGTILFAVIFWVCSVSPFGLNAGKRGAAWYLPTEDGPIPTGSYANFYQKVHQGFYQDRYAGELAELGAGLDCFLKRRDYVFVGFFDHQSLLFERVQRKIYDEPENDFPWQSYVTTNRPCLVVKTSYLRMNTFDPTSQKILRGWLEAGQVRALAVEAGDPFPSVIETGNQIPEGENIELGRRILFGMDCCRDNGYVRHQFAVPDLNATYWLPGNSTITFSNAPVYRDEGFACYTNQIAESVIYTCLMPLRYTRKDPRDLAHHK